MPESPEAKALAEQIAEQNRIDRERREALEAQPRAQRDRAQNERDRADEAGRLRRAAGEAE